MVLGPLDKANGFPRAWFPPRQSQPESVEYGGCKGGHSRPWEAGDMR